MEIYSPILFIEINNSDFIFAARDKNEQDNFKLIYKSIVPIQGIENYKITDFDLVFNTIKKNILIIEQKFNFTFKDTIIIINNFNCSFLNLTGFKKLNGSQILKENITYILNSLKSNIDQTEDKKTIIHIFNTKYSLDKKKIENLPIGLFGDFYSHELSFCLINNNDFNNLNNIFRKCNLKIKKILLKSFIEGSYISNKNSNHSTFFQIKINKKNSQVFYFENDALKFEQNFDFGSDLVLNDISKITSLNKETINFLLTNSLLVPEKENQEFVEKEYFKNENYRKIKKKLIFDIAAARIQELSEILLIKNVNLNSYLEKNKLIFLQIHDKSNFECFKDNYKLFFSKNDDLKVESNERISLEEIINNANKLVNFGWKKEVIPIIQSKKSIISRLFHTLFS